jgi:hypothetical protein
VLGGGAAGLEELHEGGRSVERVVLDGTTAVAKACAKESTTATWDLGTQARYPAPKGLDLPAGHPRHRKGKGRGPQSR